MRRLPKRPKLPATTVAKLRAETDSIASHKDQKAEANRRYKNARQAAWFRPVTEKLKKMAGIGGRCMLCSGSEASDIEHYRPKAVYPLLALTWENYLWSCTPCNRTKMDRFPPQTHPGGQLINPINEDVWDFFFIDEFGLLTPKYDIDADKLNERAITTRDFHDLNREAVQESRLSRIKDLKIQVVGVLRDLRNGYISEAELKSKINTWREQPFQPDVADYFLNGPGKSESPFHELFESIAP